MTRESLFLSGLAISLAASFSVIFYLRTHLKHVLIDLCGTPERAAFWASITHITLVLNPLIMALMYKPGLNNAMLFEVRKPIMLALTGLVMTVMLMSLFISLFVPRQARMADK